MPTSTSFSALVSVDLDPANRTFQPFSLTRLLGSVFPPTEGCRICVLTDFDDPAALFADYAFLHLIGYPIQKRAYHIFHRGLVEGTLKDLQMTGGEIYAYRSTGGSSSKGRSPVG